MTSDHPVVIHTYNFAMNMFLFIRHIMQSIGASLVALSFAVGCTVHSAGLLASFKVGNSFLFVRHLPSRSCQRWKVARRTRLSLNKIETFSEKITWIYNKSLEHLYQNTHHLIHN